MSVLYLRAMLDPRTLNGLLHSTLTCTVDLDKFLRRKSCKYTMRNSKNFYKGQTSLVQGRSFVPSTGGTPRHHTRQRHGRTANETQDTQKRRPVEDGTPGVTLTVGTGTFHGRL